MASWRYARSDAVCIEPVAGRTAVLRTWSLIVLMLGADRESRTCGRKATSRRARRLFTRMSSESCLRSGNRSRLDHRAHDAGMDLGARLDPPAEHRERDLAHRARDDTHDLVAAGDLGARLERSIVPKPP